MQFVLRCDRTSSFGSTALLANLRTTVLVRWSFCQDPHRPFVAEEHDEFQERCKAGESRPFHRVAQALGFLVERRRGPHLRSLCAGTTQKVCQ